MPHYREVLRELVPVLGLQVALHIYHELVQAGCQVLLPVAGPSQSCPYSRLLARPFADGLADFGQPVPHGLLLLLKVLPQEHSLFEGSSLLGDARVTIGLHEGP